MVQPREQLKRPGTGVTVERVPLAPTKKDLVDGTYVINPRAQGEVTSALSNLSLVSKDRASEILRDRDSKVFRNAYTSLVMERIYPNYSGLVSGENADLFDIQFDRNGSSSLRPVPAERLADMTAAQVADTIATSNQNVMTHFVCEEFKDGKIPDISGDPTKDREYYDAFQDQSALVIHSGSFFQVIPEESDPATTFITSGLQVVRTHVFGLPNLIASVAEREDIALTPDQHRIGFAETARGSMAHYYLPTGPLTIAVNNQLIDFETLGLDPDSFTHNGDPDRFMVYPRPDIVDTVNDEFSAMDDLPVQTNCPAFHSRVHTMEAVDVTLPLPRSLPEVALEQLDRWYYPKLREENPTTAPLQSEVANSFSTGRFEPGQSNIDFPSHPVLDREMVALSERESGILTRLGGHEGSQPFGHIMREVADVTIAEVVGPPDPARAELQRFFRRLVVETDGVFDSQRGDFSEAMSEGDASFLSALNQVEIRRAGEPFFTAGEALSVFGKRMLDSSLYSPRAQGLLADDLKAFVDVAVGKAKQDSAHLTSEQTLDVKEVTNGLYAQILFDIAYGQHVDQAGYFEARDRYVATNIALQYCDEVFDTFDDINEGSANLVTSYAKEAGEFNALSALGEQQNTGHEFVLFRNPEAFAAFCGSIQTVAPEGYVRVWQRQQELLQVASLPPDLATKVALPNIHTN